MVEVCPKEQKVAYISYQLNWKGINTQAKGKFIERWKNVARRLRSIKAIKFERYNKNQAVIVTSSSPIIISDEVRTAKKWLETDVHNADFQLVKQNWALTYEIRRKDNLDTQDRFLSNIFLTWPILQGRKRYELNVEDFKIAFPETHSLYSEWNDFLNALEAFSKRIIDIRRSSVNDKHAQALLSKLDTACLEGD
eukprot:XP_016664794.1 PREDICTED: uncharacterized protein LOC100571003 [Acyrthosiphon pisum]